ncbi:hypothetical protein ABZ369_40440, partial [Streptomyces sp. NPDC005918]|uniref:hypothetical protein n=1 Tax=Streptomyces sp. NPDC005918 TaxID=3155454 RepID=UPI0033D82A05
VVDERRQRDQHLDGGHRASSSWSWVSRGGWRLDVVDAAGRRAARVLLHAPLDTHDHEEDAR